MNVQVLPLKSALETLTTSFTISPNDLERDGLIRRFKHCLELCWKISKKILKANGVETETPKSVFRELAQNGWIDNPEIWFDFMKARNKVNYIYRQDIAQEVFSIIPQFIVNAEQLVSRLEVDFK